MTNRKIAILVSLLTGIIVLSGCTKKEVMEIKVDSESLTISADEREIDTDKTENKEAANIEAPPIVSEELKYTNEFSYEDSVTGEELVKKFIKTLFVLDANKPVSMVHLEIDEAVASDKIAAYKEMYGTAMEEYQRMSVTDIQVEDYNTQVLSVDGKELNTLEYKVAFTVEDNIHEIAAREQLIYVVKEGDKLKIFSNKKIEV